MLAFSILVFAAIGAVIHFAHNSYWNPPGAATANLNNNGPHGLQRNSLRLYQRHGQQRQRLRGHQREHALVQHHDRLRDADRPLPVADSAAGRGGQPGAEEAVPRLSGTFPTHGPLFVGLLVGTVVIVGALTFFPALSLGPIVEHFLMQDQARLWS